MRSYFLFFALLGIGIFPNHIIAQDQIRVSFFPGYHVVNSDQPTSQNKQTNWIFGGTISARTHLNEYPIAISLGYSQGQAMVYKSRSTIGVIWPREKIHLSLSNHSD